MGRQDPSPLGQDSPAGDYAVIPASLPLPPGSMSTLCLPSLLSSPVGPELLALPRAVALLAVPSAGPPGWGRLGAVLHPRAGPDLALALLCGRFPWPWFPLAVRLS